jgi:hypothetical protein
MNRVIEQFKSEQNISYLRQLFGERAIPTTGMHDRVYSYAANYNFDSIDPSRFWNEVRRMNVEFLRAQTKIKSMESYHMNEFMDEMIAPPEVYRYNEDDAWDVGNADRSAEQAFAEYCENIVPPDEKRRMRYESPPFWQRNGSRPYDTNRLNKSMENSVRGWDLMGRIESVNRKYQLIPTHVECHRHRPPPHQHSQRHHIQNDQ